MFDEKCFIQEYQILSSLSVLYINLEKTLQIFYMFLNNLLDYSFNFVEKRIVERM